MSVNNTTILKLNPYKWVRFQFLVHYNDVNKEPCELHFIKYSALFMYKVILSYIFYGGMYGLLYKLTIMIN